MSNTSRIMIQILVTVVLISSGCTKKTPSDSIQSYEELKKFYADPPSGYRSAPLWDWNDRITEEGIDFQMKEFKKAGIGGVFVHPRPGLLTEYLSDEWFHLFDHTIKKGKELDMKVWIYDENSYPSGFAGGHVPARMPDSYQHGAGLVMEVTEKLDFPMSDTVEVVLKKVQDEFENVTDSLIREKGKKGIYYIFRKTYPSRSQWYGGFPYVDLIYEGVTEKFLELTMTEGYEKNNLADFGKTLPGVFTDEPNLEASMPKGTLLRWTPDLWNEFEKRWGYDLRLHLPSLAEETGNWKMVRHNYYKLLLEMFIDRWAKPWNKYCSDKGLKWTGHYWEHGWPEPTHGFDEAAFYIFHQMPGVDMLGNRLDTAGLGSQFGNDRAVRELLSAANQAGYKRTLSETYGGGGWQMNFETQKRLVDWQCVLGVNFVNQHLSYYSLNGVRKFDYPPSFSYHEPWWEHYKLLGDYIGRVCLSMSAGQQVNTILVLQPNTSAWMYFSRKEKNPAITSIRTNFKNFIYRMEQQHIEYDLGSEYVLKTLGNVVEDNLIVGKRSYNLVVIPAEMETLDKTTLDLLSTYLENGGSVLSFTSNIPRVDGNESDAVNNMIPKYAGQWIHAAGLNDPDAMNMLENKNLNITNHAGNGMLYHQRRILKDGQLLFLVNSHPEEKADVTVTMEGTSITYMDLVSGKIFTYPSKTEDGKVSFHVNLQPAGSALFAVTNKKSYEPEYLPEKGTETLVENNDSMVIKRESDNILVINYLDLKTSVSEKKDIYFMNALINLFEENGVEIGNPWQHKIQYKQDYLALDSLFTDNSGFEASYHFYINPDLVPEKLHSLRVVAERPELRKLSINGHPVEKLENEFWIEKNFPVYDIGNYVKTGKNTITLQASRMNILAEIMPVYILGDFMVKPSDKGFEITGGELSTPDSWRENGLPFYSQKVSYTRKYNLAKKENTTYKIKLNHWNGTLAEVFINGEEAGVIAWKPYEINVTDLLTDGINEITVKVTGSLKNTFGAFYGNNDNWIFSPFSWNYAPEKIPSAEEYFLLDYGLFEKFDLVIKE